MKRDAMIYKCKMTTSKKTTRFLWMLFLAATVLCSLMLYSRQTNDKAELGKYDNSIHIAVDFYREYAWKKDVSEIALTDAWGRPFEIKTNPVERCMMFISKGSNLRNNEDDLTVEISHSTYRHEFTFKSHVNSAYDFYD